MPFFRCGGTSLSTIAQKVMYEKLHSCLGNSPNFKLNISCRTVANGFGVGDSNTMCVDITSRSGALDGLKKFLEYYHYSVTIAPAVTTDVWFQIWQLKGPNGGNRPESQQNDSPSGTVTKPVFSAEYQSPDYMDSFEKKQCDSVRKIIGDKISWEFTISDSWSGDPVRTYYRRIQYSSLPQISNLLQSGGYRITHSANFNQEMYRASGIQGGNYDLDFLSASYNGK